MWRASSFHKLLHEHMQCMGLLVQMHCGCAVNAANFPFPFFNICTSCCARSWCNPQQSTGLKTPTNQNPVALEHPLGSRRVRFAFLSSLERLNAKSSFSARWEDKVHLWVRMNPMVHNAKYESKEFFFKSGGRGGSGPLCSTSDILYSHGFHLSQEK